MNGKHASLSFRGLQILLTWILAPLYLMTPGTVVKVVNSYAATSEYTPARLLSRVDFPTDGKPTNPIRASPVLATSKPKTINTKKQELSLGTLQLT